jgi:hypothetical protein
MMKRGEYAIHKKTNTIMTTENAIKHEEYHCPLCEDDVIFRKGKIVIPHFSHKYKTTCKNYTNESIIHLRAKQLLENEIKKGKILHIERECSCCKNTSLWELDKLSENHNIIQEHPFLYNNVNRKADLACIDENKNILYILEICNTNPTRCEVRPEPWFEFDAYDVCEKLQDKNTDNEEILQFQCIRKNFCLDTISYGLCNICELNSEQGKIYFNQRGAGCGKTYESIQLLNSEVFIDKTIFIYLTKMRSAKDVIFEEFMSQYKRNALPGFTIIEQQNIGNQYLIILEKPDKTIIKVIIGTIDSFTYAIRSKTTSIRGGRDYFQELVKDIRNGNMSIGPNGNILYATTTVKLSKQCLINLDEGQDLEKEYIEAFEKIIRKTGIDTYIVGDKLQSILSEKNLFTYLENSQENENIIKSTGRNIIKRCHNTQFIDLINGVVDFNKYNLPEIEGVCNGNCSYKHENEEAPFIINSNFENMYTVSPDSVGENISIILSDMTEKIRKYGYLPHNFMFIFPVVNEKNRYINILYLAIQQFWVEFFENPESYNDSLLENMIKKDHETGNKYWSSKIENKEHDTKFYTHVYWHRSQTNQPINLSESINSSRILSIHASKGNGCECVYLLGLTEFILASYTSGISNTLIYDSLIHVGMTRQKKFLYIGFDGKLHDDICRRFGKYYENNENTEPNIRNIKNYIPLQMLISDFGKPPFFEKINESVLNFDEHLHLLPESAKHGIIDWGHHIIRRSVLQVMTDNYLYKNRNRQQYAKIHTLYNKKDTEIIYVLYSEYKKKIKQLNDDIQHNIKCTAENKQKRKLTVPILIFVGNDSKTDYAKYKTAIELFLENILSKLKKENFIFCPIECILYCHLMEMIHHPYSTNISIMDIYHILSCYNDCISNDMIIKEHSEEFHCKCIDCFKCNKSTFIQPHENVRNSIIHHYQAIERISNIISIYDNKIRTYTNNETLTYNSDKSIQMSGDEFIVKERFHYIGYSTNYVTYIYLTPQFNSMNFYEILIRFILQYFIIKNSDETGEYSGKIIFCSIVTLDMVEPIILNLTTLLSDKMDNITTLLYTYLFDKYSKEHSKICDYFSYHSKSNTSTKTNILYVHECMKQLDKNKKPLYNLPKYIPNFFYELDKKIHNERNKEKKRELKYNINNDTEHFITNGLNDDLKYSIETFLKINSEDSDSEYED